MRLRIAATLVLTLAGCQKLASCAGHMPQEAAARQYAADLYGASARTSCVDMDTDGDGYASCTVVVDGKAIPIECAAAFEWHSGCRAARVLVNK